MCSASELSDLLTKLLNKLYTHQDFADFEDVADVKLDLANLDPLATSPALLALQS